MAKNFRKLVKDNLVLNILFKYWVRRDKDLHVICFSYKLKMRKRKRIYSKGCKEGWWMCLLKCQRKNLRGRIRLSLSLNTDLKRNKRLGGNSRRNQFRVTLFGTILRLRLAQAFHRSVSKMVQWAYWSLNTNPVLPITHSQMRNYFQMKTCRISLNLTKKKILLLCNLPLPREKGYKWKTHISSILRISISPRNRINQKR